MAKNDKGKIIPKNLRKLKDESYGVIKPDGEIIVNWDLLYENGSSKNVG